MINYILRERYGGISTVTYTFVDAVYVLDWDLIKKTIIHDGDSYSGRPIWPIAQEMRGWIFIRL